MLWRHLQADGRTIDVAPPTVEIDGRITVLTGALHKVAQITLPNGGVEYVFECLVDGKDELRLRLIVRVAPDNPVVRFRYELVSRHATGYAGRR